MGNTYKTINIDKKLHQELMLFKIKSDAKSLPEVLKKALKLLKKHESKIKSSKAWISRI